MSYDAEHYAQLRELYRVRALLFQLEAEAAIERYNRIAEAYAEQTRQWAREIEGPPKWDMPPAPDEPVWDVPGPPK